jgi:hypothetical protein
MATDAQALEAFDALERELTPREKGLESIDLKGLCDKYKSAKKYLEIVLPFIERIPVYGSKIGIAIRFLMKMADMACPV